MKSKIRRIDSGTMYDVAGKVKNFGRYMDREGVDIRDVVFVARKADGSILTYHWGTGGREVAHYMMSTAKNRLEPV